MRKHIWPAILTPFSSHLCRLNVTNSTEGLKVLIRSLTTDTRFIKKASYSIRACLKASDARRTGDELTPKDRIFIYACLTGMIKWKCSLDESLKVAQRKRMDAFTRANQRSELPDWQETR